MQWGRKAPYISYFLVDIEYFLYQAKQPQMYHGKRAWSI